MLSLVAEHRESWLDRVLQGWPREREGRKGGEGKIWGWVDWDLIRLIMGIAGTNILQSG